MRCQNLSRRHFFTLCFLGLTHCRLVCWLGMLKANGIHYHIHRETNKAARESGLD